MTAAKEEILAHVRAVDRGTPAPVARRYIRTGGLDRAARVARFCSRVADYRADVRRLSADEVAAAIDSVCRERGVLRLGVPAGLPPAWRPDALELVDDRELTARELDALGGVVTGCTVAVADTGTIVLAAGPSEGRRALTLVPDLHVCVIRDEQIVELVPEAIAALDRLVAQERRPLTFISGPSATSDIELSRVEGVHGPRTLVALVVTEEEET
jgi:L-lactate dehydrogenase complex protein LldG